MGNLIKKMAATFLVLSFVSMQIIPVSYSSVSPINSQKSQLIQESNPTDTALGSAKVAEKNATAELAGYTNSMHQATGTIKATAVAQYRSVVLNIKITDQTSIPMGSTLLVEIVDSAGSVVTAGRHYVSIDDISP